MSPAWLVYPYIILIGDKVVGWFSEISVGYNQVICFTEFPSLEQQSLPLCTFWNPLALSVCAKVISYNDKIIVILHQWSNLQKGFLILVYLDMCKRPLPASNCSVEDARNSLYICICIYVSSCHCALIVNKYLQEAMLSSCNLLWKHDQPLCGSCLEHLQRYYFTAREVKGDDRKNAWV